jgi:dTDP-glucose 4,6-dehydratase
LFTFNVPFPDNMPAIHFLTPPGSPPVKDLALDTGRASDLEGQSLIGTTRFEPRSDVKSILITGGAGFM